MISTIIFDLDGTLADSSQCIVEAMNATEQTMNLVPASAEAIRAQIGLPLGEMLVSLYGIPAEQIVAAISIYSDHYRRLTASFECLFEGMLPLLQTLRGKHLKLAIATGKSQEGAEHATARLGIVQYFDTIHGILPNTPGKPDPAVLNRVVEALGVSAEECLMVGDTTFDMKMAQSIGMHTLAVTWGVHSVSELQACGVDRIAEDPHELLPLILQCCFGMDFENSSS